MGLPIWKSYSSETIVFPHCLSDQFQGLTSLRQLELLGNQIPSLSANQFQGLTNLQKLSLYDNHISSLSANQFQGLTGLESLSLWRNQIPSLSANQFHDLTNLWASSSRLKTEISTLSANQFQGLSRLEVLGLGYNQISSLCPGQFRGLTEIWRLDLEYNQITSLDLTGLETTELRMFSIRGNPITRVVLADATLTQTPFNALMVGHAVTSGVDGCTEIRGIASMDFTGADMTGVEQFDEMFAMADLEELVLTEVVFSDAIVADGYAEAWDLISALEANKLDSLTVDWSLYNAMKTNLDAWDAEAGNVLTVVPEPSMMTFLLLGGLMLMLRCGRVAARLTQRT